MIALVGPESTGKSQLSQELAAHYKGSAVAEFARKYLHERAGQYDQSDLPKIAQGQYNLEQEAIAQGEFPIICDTDLVVIKVWHEFKYGQPNTYIDTLLAKQPPRKYLLMYPDLTWEPDPLRENPHDRLELFGWYERVLQSIHADYRVVKGLGTERIKQAIDAINQMKTS